MKSNLRIAVLALVSASLAVPAMAQQAGEATYKAKCAMCHGADGTGNTPIGKNMKLRSFKSPEDIKATDADLFKQTKDGVGKMQGYAGKLTDAQIQDVVTYIRTLQK
jgi:mono/diheme cytochrome c family protein